MNNIKKTIGWADYSWNPVFGCAGVCEYCYARRAAVRFAKPWGLDPADPFKPTFHDGRLDEPLDLGGSRRIFVCSMADLFGDWVNPLWIKAIILRAKLCPWHTFIFLTKNPARYAEFDFPQNCWLGVSVEGVCGDANRDRMIDFDIEPSLKKNIRFVSWEPILSPFMHRTLHGRFWEERLMDWLTMGALTGPGAKKYAPDPRWIADAVAQCRERGIPIFEKSSLAQIVKRPLIQEWPKRSS